MRHPVIQGDAELVWVACAACWGQRRIYRREAGRLCGIPCPWCLGVGEDLRHPAHR